jgi:hypothetical protein
MFPWHTKRILVIIGTLRLFVLTFSIALRSGLVQMNIVLNLPHQLQLDPAKPCRGFQIPTALVQRQVSLQDDHVLGPADIHRQLQQFRGVFIHPIEVTHPAQVARGET